MTHLKNYQQGVYLLLTFWVISLLLLAGLVGWGHIALHRDTRIAGERKLVQALHLTDFCLATESRHTRHISLPEPIAPFQDVPGYLDHFPTSTFFWPPPQARVWNHLYLQKQFPKSAGKKISVRGERGDGAKQ